MTSWSDGIDHRDEVYAIVSKIMPEKTTDQWMEILYEHKLWAGPVYTYHDLVNDPHVIETEMIAEVQHPTIGTLRMPNIPIRLSETPGTIRMPPPLLGEHTDDVLLGWGFDAGDVGPNVRFETIRTSVGAGVRRVAVGDQILSETGNMNGPTQQAISTDTDSRLNRAAVAPYNGDSYQGPIHPGNPRVMILPLVDWTGVSGSRAVPVKGFAAFWLDSASGGQISGRFIRYTLSPVGGSGWDSDNVDISTLGQGTFDGGVAIATLAQ